MIEEIKKIIKASSYEKASSPLFGTFVMSWIVWNWKIPYLILFVANSKLSKSKLETIKTLYIDQYCLKSLIMPLISSILFILIAPFFSNIHFQISQKFKLWRVNKRKKIKSNERLAFNKYFDYTKKINLIEADFKNITNKNDDKINRLKKVIETLESGVYSIDNDEIDKIIEE